MARPSKAIINLAAVKHNYQIAKNLAPDSQCLAVVKANAYGHGAVAIASALEPLAPAFGVACIEEADELRAAGIKKPILLLAGVFTADEVVLAEQKNYWLMVHTDEQVAAILSTKLSGPIKVWLKIDTGMHRLGFAPKTISSVYNSLKSSVNVDDEIVLATHLACGEQLDNTFSKKQIECFKNTVSNINAPLSIANSPGLLGWPEARAEWNRPGYMLYGNSPFSGPHKQADKLQHVMTLKSEVIALRSIAAGETVGYSATWTANRSSKVATVAVGYGDGYPRHAPSGTPVLVNGSRAELVGRVSMDMITVDVTDLQSVMIGDEVILWGDELTANEVASWVDTIGYEVLTRMPLRIPRIYR
jgi:alanine racemase